MPKLEFILEDKPLTAEIDTLIVAGWTGRNAAAVEHHIAELEAIGVARPRSVPTFYRLGANLLTTDKKLDFTGPDASGEAEFVLFSLPEGLFVGVGSDHTDRKVEAYGVTVSKQMCPKPVSTHVWQFEDLKDHWDSLLLRSYVTREGERSLYQEGPVTRMLPPADLVARLHEDGFLPHGTAMFCGTLPVIGTISGGDRFEIGTLPVIGTISGGDRFEIELVDPILGRSLKHHYDARILPFAD